jgi:hypothetical protein
MFVAEFSASTFIMRFRDMNCSFFRGKQSRRSLKIKRDCMNVNGNIGERGECGGKVVERGKDANISRTFVLVTSRNDMVRFKVNIVKRGSEFGDGCEPLKDKVKHVLELVM